MEFEIKPQRKFSLGIKELWDYRELFYFFTWRDVKVKYKQTVLGFLWAIIQPLFMTVVFTVFFGDSISQKTNLLIPYPVFALSGMLLWGIFSGGMSNAANSMVNNANIIKKIYFPRLIIPISAILVALIDFFVAFVVFIVVLFIYKVEIELSVLFLLPVSILITCLASMGCGVLLAALNVKYRDVRYIIPFLVQGLLFLTPVMYPVGISDSKTVQLILKLNPLSGALELMRGLFSGYSINMETVLMSLASSIFLFVVGVIYFRKTESYFADLA
ncbi:MAG: ABC transporter permease [Burkholderiales bacterium]|nr:ABC transporter permease [Bacteroidia bacterium]